jgi:hypothetical protein
MHPDFSVAKIEKTCANYASKYGTWISLPDCASVWTGFLDPLTSLFKNSDRTFDTDSPVQKSCNADPHNYLLLLTLSPAKIDTTDYL